MTRSEIFKLAKQAGGHFDGSDWKFCCDFDEEELERFAALVAEKEREACAQVCENFNPEHSKVNCYDRAMAQAIRARTKP